MTTDPRTEQTIYESIVKSLTGKIEKLSNFTNRSFNAIFTAAISQEVRRLEERATVAELTGLVDYVGGDVDDAQIEDLGLDGQISSNRVNELMNEEYLDEYVKIVGVDRFEGEPATGTVTFTTQSAETEIPEGTTVTTIPESDGSTLEFDTTETVTTAEGVTTITGVQIEANEIGREHNLPADTIVRLSDPPIGVRGVTNPESTTGGEDRESNESLRTRAKNKIETASGGGTARGIEGYIKQNVESVGQGDVATLEFTDVQPPYVDVVVDGGLDEDVSAAIEESRPTGIRHYLIRPQIVQLGYNVDLLGEDIDNDNVVDTIETFLLELGIGDNFYQDELIRKIMNADEDIINIDDLNGIIERVTNESFTFDETQTDYRLDYTFDHNNGEIDIYDKGGQAYTLGQNFETIDQTGDGYHDTISWTGSTPDDGEQFFVDYDVTVQDKTLDSDQYDSNLVRGETFTFNLNKEETFEFGGISNTYRLESAPFEDAITIEDQTGATYTKDTDWQLAPLIPLADEDEFTFDSTDTLEYTLSEELVIDDVAIIDADENIYVRGTDYTLIDTDGDGTPDTISWDDTASVPVDGTNFTVNYNGHSRTIRWDTNASNPTSGDNFTVTYDQELYSTEYDIEETPGGIIRDASGDLYNEDTEYVLTDCSCGGELSAIRWTENPSTLDSGEEFYISYYTEGDVHFSDRAKADPGTIGVRHTF